MYDRLITERISQSKKSILLLGARQVGKSTLIGSLAPQKVINFADEEKFLSYSKDPSFLRREIDALTKPSLIAIDEIQRIPKLLNTIQAIIDAGKLKHKFILTGSSARKLKKKGANLLTGRILLEHLDPLTFLELKDDFDLTRSLQIGALPGIQTDLEEGVRTLGAYAEIYLREEIRQESEVRDIGSYARFLDVAAISSGQWLNYSKISSDAEIPKETVRRYVALLEDTFLIFRLPPFKPLRKISRRVAQHEKIFFFDLGVRNALLGLHHRSPSQDQIGFLFEHWFILQVIYLNRAFQKNWKLSVYRSSGGAEVDLVVERESDIIGIEVKSGAQVTNSDTRGLESLSEITGKIKLLQKWIAYRGDTPQKFENGTLALPFLEALKLLVSE